MDVGEVVVATMGPVVSGAMEQDCFLTSCITTTVCSWVVSVVLVVAIKVLSSVCCGADRE